MINAHPYVPFVATLIGAPTNLVGQLTYSVVEKATGDVETPPTTAGIQEISPSVYTKQNTAPGDTGDYLIVWALGATLASEDLVVSVLEQATTTYASVDQVRAYAPELQTVSSYDIALQVTRAERDIDWYAGFGGTVNDVSGLRFDPLSDLDAPVSAAITRATCAQTAYRFYMGEAFFTDTVQYRQTNDGTPVSGAQRVGPQARSEFPQGYRKLTGRWT